MTLLASPENGRRTALRLALVAAPAILLLGFLSAQVSQSGPQNAWFMALAKPAAYPPPAAFGIVWSVLYALMGVALALVLAAPRGHWRRVAAILFAVQLVVNLAWSPMFFGAHRITTALVLILVLDVLVAATIRAFARVSRPAAWLLAPYLAWVLFASYLNWAFLSANPGADGAAGPVFASHVEIG